MTEARCSGRLEAAMALSDSSNAYRVVGFARDAARARAAARVLLTDAQGLIVGYALGGRQFLGLGPPAFAEVRRDGWRGHVVARQSTELRAYALLDDGDTACMLDGTVPVTVSGP
jgi:hypothetical protein